MTDKTTTLNGNASKIGPAPSVSLEHVEWRIDSAAYKRRDDASCRWVPYLSASRVMMIMDEWVGPDRWRIDGYELVHWGKDGLECTISVFFEGVGWVPKKGAGNISAGFEAVKANESDAFRRCAGRTWGAGRNVYELPTLWAPCRFKDGTLDKKGNLKALGATQDTEHALLTQLTAKGFSDAVVRISSATEGPDEFGEGPTGQVIPDTSAEVRTEEPAGRATPKPAEAAPEASESFDDAKRMLSELSGPLPRQARDNLKKARLWPIGGVDLSAAAVKATIAIIADLAESQRESEAV